MKEVRAVVLGLVVVLLIAMMFGFWNRPAKEFTRIKEFKVEVRQREGDSTRRLSFKVPTTLISRIAKLSHLDSIGGGHLSTDWGNGELTAQDILEAADKSEPGKPSVIEKGDSKIEVSDEKGTLAIDVKDSWDKQVHIRVPRALLEGLSDDRTISTSEILHRLDELEPGDVVTIKDSDSEVTITAVPRKNFHLHVS
ncbi:MAG TPA: hypothetical protein VGH97_00400 [Thermoanaerobaculia bacterium]|jgi:hypothetical protein